MTYRERDKSEGAVRALYAWAIPCACREANWVEPEYLGTACGLALHSTMLLFCVLQDPSTNRPSTLKQPSRPPETSWTGPDLMPSAGSSVDRKARVHESVKDCFESSY